MNEGGPSGRFAPSAMKGGTACSLRSRCPPFDPHVMSRQSPDITSASPLVLPHVVSGQSPAATSDGLTWKG